MAASALIAAGSVIVGPLFQAPHAKVESMRILVIEDDMEAAAHLAKGLEFDRVIVADVSAGNYRTEMDRNLLYVACTRAMHRLTLYSVGDPSSFLPPSAQG